MLRQGSNSARLIKATYDDRGVASSRAFPETEAVGPVDDPCHLAYFQFLTMPSAIHATAVSSRLARVASALASVTHSTYSFLWLWLNPSKAAFAFAFFRMAFMK